MPVSQFVLKLLTILDNESETINWINDGTEFQIINIHSFTNSVLPHYFRHQSFNSFIRQLNMYGFHKINRRQNSYIYQHEHFLRDKTQNYVLIKRLCKSNSHHKSKNQAYLQLNVSNALLNQRAPKLAEFLTKLIQFNTQNDFDHRKLKNKLAFLMKEVSSKTRRSLEPMVKIIKQKIQILEQVENKISNLNLSTLASLPQDSPSKNVQQEAQNLDEYSKKVMSAPAFVFKNQQESSKEFHQGGVSFNHIRSFGSISSFIVLG